MKSESDRVLFMLYTTVIVVYNVDLDQGQGIVFIINREYREYREDREILVSCKIFVANVKRLTKFNVIFVGTIEDFDNFMFER